MIDKITRRKVVILKIEQIQ